MSFNRRKFVKAAGATAALGFPGISFSQSNPIRLGLMTVKTGPLASGGIDMERALVQYLRERNNTLAGRKVELFVGDSAGVPAQARTKIQELVERDRIHMMIGPLAAAEALAADDYIRQAQLLTLSVAAAEDLTQRKPNPWFTRGTATSAQCAHPMADYAYKDMKMRRMATIADDFAYGHEMCAGFQRVFEEHGGKIVQKMFPPLTVPDYGTYLAQLKNVDGIFLGFAGANGFRYLRQFNEYGLMKKVVPVGGMTALDEAVLRNMGDEALGIVTSCWYSAEIENAINKRFVANFRIDWKYDPGFYAAATYTEAAVLEATLEKIGGRIEDKPAFMKAVRSLKNVETCRGPVSFDQYGNVVGNVYIRKVERKDGRLVNRVIKTYPNVSQFWTYKPEEFLKNPVYSRDYPPAKNLES